MSASLPHYVTVEPWEYSGDKDFPATVHFECPWLYGECHFYPECSCESWDAHHLKDHGPGHEKVWHEECWMKSWFYGDAHVYEGDDADDMHDDNCVPRSMNRSGEVKVSYEDDYVSWEFVS